MAFHLSDAEEQGVNEINLIPLIDIMLVLMIIFLVTATVMNPSVPLKLPSTVAQQQPEPPKVINVQINAQGQVYWDNQPVSTEQLQAQMQQAALLPLKPSLQMRIDKTTAYDRVAQVMAQASRAGLSDIAFMSDPAK